MARFNYSASAELFPGRNRARKSPLAYHRFDTAAEALRYAMEELPATLLNGALLEVDEQRYSWAQMQALYDSPDYPLERERELAMASQAIAVTAKVSSVTFTRPFVLPGMDEPHAPGTFEIVVESETLDVWWPAYKNTTTIMLTGNGATEAWPVIQGDLDAALAADRAAGLDAGTAAY